MTLFELRGRVPFSSDQSIIGLIGLDILNHGKHPVFCYGSEYGGTLEPHLLALTFGLFGASPAVFRVTLAVLVVLLVLAVWAFTRRAFGEGAAFAAGLYLAIAPSFFLYKGLTSDGAYTSLLLLSALALLFALRVDDHFEWNQVDGLRSPAQPDTRKTALDLLVLGGLLGMAWWVHPLSIFLGAPIAILALTGRWRLWLGPKSLALLALGFLVGDFPWWWHNVRHGFPSLKAPEMAAATSAQGVDPLSERLGDLFRLGWNDVLGGRSTWAHGTTFPGSTAIAIVLLLVLLGFGLYQLRAAAGRARRRHAAMLVSILVAVPVLNLAIARTDFVDPRYLLPTYLAIAPLAGLAVVSLRPRALAALLATALLGMNLASQWTAPQLAGREGGRFDVSGARLVAEIRARGIDSLYASYWTAYRIAFLSGGMIAASPFGTSTNSFVRDLDLRAKVDADPHPSFLLSGEDRRRLTELLERRGLPSKRETLEGYTLFSDLDPDFAGKLRACHCIPAAASPGDIEWLKAEGPTEMHRGERAIFTVEFRTFLLMPFSNNVHLSYRWRPADGSAAVEGDRVMLVTKAMRGATVEAELPVVADLPPGKHRLVIDLVEENFAWFEDLGLPPKSLDVAVVP